MTAAHQQGAVGCFGFTFEEASCRPSHSQWFSSREGEQAPFLLLSRPVRSVTSSALHRRSVHLSIAPTQHSFLSKGKEIIAKIVIILPSVRTRRMTMIDSFEHLDGLLRRTVNQQLCPFGEASPRVFSPGEELKVRFFSLLLLPNCSVG